MIRSLRQVRVYACLQPTDMRRSFDGLSGMVRELLQQDPLSGALFLFRYRSRDRLKILYWDHNGLAIWYRRQECSSFHQRHILVRSGFVMMRRSPRPSTDP